jgi:hypothetical protein
MQSPGSSIPGFIKDDSFVLISCQSGSYDLDKEICSLSLAYISFFLLAGLPFILLNILCFMLSNYVNSSVRVVLFILI